MRAVRRDSSAAFPIPGRRAADTRTRATPAIASRSPCSARAAMPSRRAGTFLSLPPAWMARSKAPRASPANRCKRRTNLRRGDLATARALLLVLATCIAGNAAAVELILPPGASVTILDAEDPAVRIVMTAPPDKALDLSELLTLKPEESVRSIVTRFQASYAGSMSRNPDGSITLGPSGPAQTRAPTPGLAGGGLARNGAQWMIQPRAPQAAV